MCVVKCDCGVTQTQAATAKHRLMGARDASVFLVFDSSCQRTLSCGSRLAKRVGYVSVSMRSAYTIIGKLGAWVRSVDERCPTQPSARAEDVRRCVLLLPPPKSAVEGGERGERPNGS